MADTTKAKDAPPKDTADESTEVDPAVTAAVEKQTKAEELARQRADLERALARLDAKAKDEGLSPEAVPTHILLLADGSRVESAGAVPTHYARDDGRVLPVERAYSLEGMNPNA